MGKVTGMKYPSGRVVNTWYDVAGRISVVGGTSCTAAGNLASLGSNSSPGTVASTFGYDGESRMTGSNVANTGAVTYVYDGSGQRVEKLAGGNKTVYVYDAQGQLAAEYWTAANPTTGTEFLTADPLGSTRLVTNAAGGVLKRYDYVPFGEEIAAGIGGRAQADGYGSGVYPNAPDVLSEKFTAKERDAESGLDYFGARYYGSALGRLTSPDQPFADQNTNDPQSWNLYSYVRNNPLNRIDPDGHLTVIIPGTEWSPSSWNENMKLFNEAREKFHDPDVPHSALERQPSGQCNGRWRERADRDGLRAHFRTRGTVERDRPQPRRRCCD